MARTKTFLIFMIFFQESRVPQTYVFLEFADSPNVDFQGPTKLQNMDFLEILFKGLSGALNVAILRLFLRTF